MIKLENTITPSVDQWNAIIMGARNPLNSWDRMDSEEYVESTWDENKLTLTPSLKLGTNDYNLLTRLAKAGSDHGKFMRMITVFVDITAPLYWWKEFDTYKVGTVANSCSTMHKIHAKEFTLDDFSHEHLMGEDRGISYKSTTMYNFKKMLLQTIKVLNCARAWYLETKDKKYWWQMIQLLPSSYNQKRTVMLNYEVLKNMYNARKNHKLDEWHDFCDWIETLPYSELITGKTLK